MLLILTNKFDISADAVIEKLHHQNIPFFRWNLEDFLISHILELVMVDGEVKKAKLIAEDRMIDLQKDISVVWYRRPGRLTPRQEITDSVNVEFSIREGNVLLNNLWCLLKDKVWVNHPFQNRLIDNKLYQLQLARKVGLTTPFTLVTNNPKEVIKLKKKI